MGSKGENSIVMGKNLCGKIHKEWEARKKNKGCVIVSPCQSLKPNFHLRVLDFSIPGFHNF